MPQCRPRHSCQPHVQHSPHDQGAARRDSHGPDEAPCKYSHERSPCGNLAVTGSIAVRIENSMPLHWLRSQPEELPAYDRHLVLPAMRNLSTVCTCLYPGGSSSAAQPQGHVSVQPTVRMPAACGSMWPPEVGAVSLRRKYLSIGQCPGLQRLQFEHGVLCMRADAARWPFCFLRVNATEMWCDWCDPCHRCVV